ncbi:FtsK/SpoIIIE domain-containing protein, partial [Streptomyces sp. NPDC002454]
MTEQRVEAEVHSLDDRRTARERQAPPPVDVVAEVVEAVDRPDNPLADWLTLPDTPVLPVWARSRASIVANVRAFGRLAWWHGRFHGLRTPKYLVKAVWLAARGFFRAVVGLWPTLSAQDHTAAVRALREQSKQKPEDVDLALRLQLAHAARTQTRRWRFGAAATAVAATATGVALAPLMLQLGAAAAVAAPLAY